MINCKKNKFNIENYSLITSICDIQKIEYNILCEFKRFCNQYGIKYNLVGGTLLGAIRHGGFIPWDDDIDVGVLRKDYDFLIKLLEEDPSMGTNNLLAHIPGKANYNFPFIKIVNIDTLAFECDGNKGEVWIDVFPMDFLCDLKEDRRAVYITLNKFRYRLAMSKQDWKHYYNDHHKFIFLQFGRWIWLHLLGPQYYIRKITDKKYYGVQGKEYVGDLVWQMHPEKDKYSLEDFCEQIEVKFENELFTIPAEYDRILTNFYGDYMTPPPLNERSGHIIKAYLKNNRE